MKIVVRDIPPRAACTPEQAGVHPLLAKPDAARGVIAADELDVDLEPATESLVGELEGRIAPARAAH